MIVHKDLAHLPVFTNAVITIGTFDGVHTGHQQIIALMTREASRIKGETIIITFHPHPRKVIDVSKDPVFLLNTLDEKIELLQQFGIDHLVVVPFTEAFSNQSAESYINDFLVKTFHPNTIIIGHDHHFGKNRTGNYDLLEAMAPENNYTVKEIPVHVLKNITISSTKIRQALLSSDPATANEYLGYDYFFSGTVIEGNKLGRTIGFPTANIVTADANKLIPGNGVYAVLVERSNTTEKKILKGMMNIGVRPTVDGANRMIEVNIFDFDEMIYGSILKVYIKKRLRQEQKFVGLDALKLQLANDKTMAIAALDK